MFIRNIIAECRAAAFMRFFERADLPGSVQCSVVARGGAAAIALLHYVIVQTLNGRVRVAR